MVAEYLIEKLARVPVEVEHASEFRYRNSPKSGRSLVIAVSQSGETLDTLEAVREAKTKGLLTLGITNVVGSSLARETDGEVYGALVQIVLPHQNVFFRFAYVRCSDWLSAECVIYLPLMEQALWTL